MANMRTAADCFTAMAAEIDHYTTKGEVFAFYTDDNTHLGSIIWIPPGVDSTAFLRERVAASERRRQRAATVERGWNVIDGDHH